MQCVDEHLHALQIFLSNVACDEKRRAILEGTRNGATRAEVDRFLSRRRPVDEFLAFMSSTDARRTELPLIVRNHLRHLVHNPIIQLAIGGRGVPIEPVMKTELPVPLPDVLSYVLKRLDGRETFDLTNGWRLASAEMRRCVEDDYASHARERGVDSVWHGGALIVAMSYAGMGHHMVLAAAPDGTFFKFLEGGANGYDRETNFDIAARISSDEIAERAVPWTILVEGSF